MSTTQIACHNGYVNVFEDAEGNICFQAKAEDPNGVLLMNNEQADSVAHHLQVIIQGREQADYDPPPIQSPSCGYCGRTIPPDDSDQEFCCYDHRVLFFNTKQQG